MSSPWNCFDLRLSSIKYIMCPWIWTGGACMSHDPQTCWNRYILFDSWQLLDLSCCSLLRCCVYFFFFFPPSTVSSTCPAKPIAPRLSLWASFLVPGGSSSHTHLPFRYWYTDLYTPSSVTQDSHQSDSCPRRSPPKSQDFVGAKMNRRIAAGFLFASTMTLLMSLYFWTNIPLVPSRATRGAREKFPSQGPRNSTLGFQKIYYISMPQ